jgi:hypothetical protein
MKTTMTTITSPMPLVLDSVEPKIMHLCKPVSISKREMTITPIHRHQCRRLGNMIPSKVHNSLEIDLNLKEIYEMPVKNSK